MVVWGKSDFRGELSCYKFCFLRSAKKEALQTDPGLGYPQFNYINGLSLIARAHQLVQEGYKHMFDESLVTVWSAPNYCYRCGNAASIMQVDEDGRTSFKVYDAAVENSTDQKNPAMRRVVSKEKTNLFWLVS